MKQAKEVWKDIKDYEGLYQISNFGRVKSLARTRKGRDNAIVPVRELILKPNHDKNGYQYVSISKNAKAKSFKVHRLVAIAFVHNAHPDTLIVVDHLDNIKTHNIYTNLEWVTISTNTQRSFDEGCQVIPRGKDHHLSMSVLQIDITTGIAINKYGSLNEARRCTGVDDASISKACRGKAKTAGGFKWRYAND